MIGIFIFNFKNIFYEKSLLETERMSIYPTKPTSSVSGRLR